jgi:hypothetical protein
MRPRWGAAVVVATAFLGAAVAAAAVTDKVAIGGSNTTLDFSSASFVVVTSPPELDTRTGFDGNSGGWQGPRCETGNVPRSPLVTMTWSVGYHDDVGGPEQAARKGLTFDWTTVEQGPIAVRHVVAGRRVGTLPGFFVVTDARSQTGYHESAVGIRIGRGVHAAAAFWSRGNALDCTVQSTQGPIPVATWHRTKAREAVGLVEVEGNLPPARVTARSTRVGAAGRVTDSFGHPDAQATVRLERRSGSRWRRVASARTGVNGTYSIASRARGRLRVVAAVGRATATSRPFRR